MVPLPTRVKAEIGGRGSEKRDYRNLGVAPNCGSGGTISFIVYFRSYFLRSYHPSCIWVSSQHQCATVSMGFPAQRVYEASGFGDNALRSAFIAGFGLLPAGRVRDITSPLLWRPVRAGNGC